MPLLPLLIGIFGTAGFFIWLIIYLFVLQQEKGERMVGWLAGFISWASKKAEKTATANKIQGKIDSFVASVNTEVEGLLPFGLKIKWVTPDIDKDAFIDRDRVVVLLNHHQNQDENLSRATVLYMNKAVIPEARPHIDQKLCKAIDLMMTKKALFSFIEARSSLGHFTESVLKPQVEQDLELKELCDVIQSIDGKGLFTRILLRELLELGRRKSGTMESGDTVHESSEFVKFLKEIAQKEQGQDVPLTFNRKNIKIAIILIAKPERALFFESGVFEWRVRERIRQSINVIYLLARGSYNIQLAKVVSKSCEQVSGLFKVWEGEYATFFESGNPNRVFYAIFYNRNLIQESSKDLT